MDVKPFGEYYSKPDCNATDAAAGNCVSHGEVEDYVHVPEPTTILGSATALAFGAFFKRKLKPSQSAKKETEKVG